MARGLSRPSMLDSARRASRAQVARRVQRLSAPSGRTVVGVLVAYEEEPEPRAEVEVLGSTLWLGATPGGYVRGGGVHVQVDDQGRPFWVVGPTGTPVPDSLVPTTPGEGAVPIVVQPDLSIDPEARQRNEQIAQELDDAIDSWTDTVENTLPAVEARVDQVRDLIAAVRERVGYKRWVWAPGAGPQVLVVHDPEPTTTEFVRAEPLGDGKVKFTALIPGVHTDWQVGAATGLADGDTYTHTFTETGTLWVRVRTDGVLHQAPFTVEPAVLGPADGLGSWEDMEWPDIDWSEGTFSLEQLTAPGGPLDPEWLADVFLPAVAGAFVVATEAFVGGNAIIENAVEAKHVRASESLSAKVAQFLTVTTGMLNVVTQEPGGAVAITDDGVRMWRAGNDPATGQPNVALTTTDGFRIQTDTGDGLLWIDPATGDLHTAGAVTTGGTITGATINIPGAFHASPAAGVVVGGAVQIYTRGTYTSTAESGFFTDPVPVAPGSTYRALYRLERSTDTGDDHHQVWVVWFNGGTEVSRRILVAHPGAPLYDEGSVTDAAFTAPAGVTHVRLLFTREVAPVTTRVSDIAVFETSEGNVTVSGDVHGSTGVFNRIQVGGTVIEGHRVAVPTGLGGFDPSEASIVYSVGGTAHLYGTLSRTLADVSVGNTFRQCLQLPAGFRPAYTHYTTVMNNDGQVFQAIINPAGVVSIRTPGGSQTWQQGKTMPLAMFGPFILGGQ